jgi:alpha-N-acetylglucosamine transferase
VIGHEYGKVDKLNISVVICDTDIPLDSCDRPWIWKGRQIEHIHGHLWHKHSTRFLMAYHKSLVECLCHKWPRICSICRPFHMHGLSQESSGMSVSQMTTDMFNLSFFPYSWPITRVDKLNISVVICDTDIPLDSCDRPWIWKGRQIEHIRGHLWHRHSTRLLW